MKNISQKFVRISKRLLVEETGAEVIEYVLILGLIVVITIATLVLFGNKVIARWTSINTSI